MMVAGNPAYSLLLQAGAVCFGNAGAFSLAINLLYLAGPLYMLQLYDRVVPSSNGLTGSAGGVDCRLTRTPR